MHGVVEAEQGGLAIGTGAGPQVAQLQSDLAKARDEIEILKRDRSRLWAEVARPAAPKSEPSRRGDPPRYKGNGDGQCQTLPTLDAVFYPLCSSPLYLDQFVESQRTSTHLDESSTP